MYEKKTNSAEFPIAILGLRNYNFVTLKNLQRKMRELLIHLKNWHLPWEKKSKLTTWENQFAINFTLT